jgi:hypothetical protein
MSKRISNIISIALMVIGAAFGIYTWVVTGQSDDKIVQAGSIDPLFIWTYILVAVAILALIIVPLPYMIKNPKILVKFGVGVVALGAVLLLAYMFSSNVSLPFIGTQAEVAEKNSWSTWADVNIISMYIMTAFALVVILWSSLRGIFSK